MGRPTKLERPRVFRCFAPTIAFALVLGLVPGPGRAQTNIDQGKSPAEIFSQDCATCHKTARGLANGRSSATLAGFLVEHYTSSRDQAAALAAYVMGAGGGDSVPATAQGHGPKPPTPDRGRAALDESKPAPTRQTGRTDESRPATAKLQPPAGDESRRPPVDVPSAVQEPASPATPGRRPATAYRRDVPPPTPATRSRNKREPDYAPPAEPAAVVAEPSATTSAPAQEVVPVPAASAAAPANGDSGTSAPVPRDDIPD
jgi:hypothetical protein